MAMDIDSPLSDLPNDFDMGGEVDAPATPSSDTGAMDMRITTPNDAAEYRQIIVKDEEMDIDLVATETTRPEKRRRVLMDAVMVPFVRSVRAHADAERRAIDQKFQAQLHNPKVKKPKDTPVLSLDTVRDRLRTNNISLEPYPIDLERDILDVTVTREFMSNEYGGNPQMTFPPISDEYFPKTGLKRFMYLNLLINPQCPEVPGAPGLFFDCTDDVEGEGDEEDEKDEDRSDEEQNIDRESEDEDEGNDNEAHTSDEGDRNDKAAKDEAIKEEDEEDKKPVGQDSKPYILFSRLDKNVWQYQGQYVMAPAENLTIEEWKQQPRKVGFTMSPAHLMIARQARQTLAHHLSKKNWGISLRVDIAL
ncbi:hypothetical protein B0H19DRAFT_298256 [Mycena capillaripes]|nr:hypothetical protein B0H19DRAFT_298256 [Mycena capillaripes]